jgi:hypothetical protein
MPVTQETAGAHEKTYQIIAEGLKTNPAYLLLLAVGLLGGTISTVVGVVGDDRVVQFLVTGIWVLLLIGSFLVIRTIELKKATPEARPLIPDLGALSAFRVGSNAASYSGRWKVYWYENSGSARMPYAADPTDEIVVSAADASIFCSSYDPSTNHSYWMLGKLSDSGYCNLMYWSKALRDTSSLTGTVLLQPLSTDRKWLRGKWTGVTRNGDVVSGDVEWEFLG